MLGILRRILEFFAPKLALRIRAGRILSTARYLRDTGWLLSFELKIPVDAQGQPVPWMNFPIVKFLGERLTPDMLLFEFGSGQSTLFFSRRVKAVTSVEYDEAWYQSVKSRAPANVTLMFKAVDYDGQYCRSVAEQGQLYDIVVVDGRDRVNCIKQSIPCLSPGGVVILDDSDRENYRVGIEYALERGFRALDWEGLKPTNTNTERSTLLYRDGNCLGL